MMVAPMGLSSVVPLAGTWIEIHNHMASGCNASVVPLAGTWIEILIRFRLSFPCVVVPLAGTWIEILRLLIGFKLVSSFPSRERGLKYRKRLFVLMYFRRSPRGNVD